MIRDPYIKKTSWKSFTDDVGKDKMTRGALVEVVRVMMEEVRKRSWMGWGLERMNPK